MAKHRGGRRNRTDHGAHVREEARFLARAVNVRGVKKVNLGSAQGRKHRHPPGLLLLRGFERGSLVLDIFTAGGVRRVYICLESGASPDEIAGALGVAPRL